MLQRSIDRSKDKDAAQLQEILYEGYGPAGVAILVETATDNINRTLPEVRLAFTKHGGNLAPQTLHLSLSETDQNAPRWRLPPPQIHPFISCPSPTSARCPPAT